VKIRFSYKTHGKGPLSPTVGGILVCLFMTAFTAVAIRQGGLNFGAVAIMAMFWIVGIAMIAQGVMKRLGTYDKTAVKDLAPKIIIMAFGACMAAVGLWLDIGKAWEELFVKKNGWSLSLASELAFATLFAVIGSFCLVMGIAGLHARRRDAFADQRTAKAYLDFPLRRVMSQKVRGTVFFSVLWWVFLFVFVTVFWSQHPGWEHLVPLLPFVGIGIFLAVKALRLIARHHARCFHWVRLNTSALYPGGEVTVAYEAIRPFVGGKMCAVVSQLDMSIREMRPGESTDVDADKSAKDVVAKQLSCASGRFSFRMPKARYAERIRWELRLQFKLENGDFVDEHFRLPLS